MSGAQALLFRTDENATEPPRQPPKRAPEPAAPPAAPATSTPPAAKPRKARKRKPANVTAKQFAAYEGMFSFFNRTLFASKLRPVLLNFSRHSGALGFFAPSRWATGDGADVAKTDVRHEISLNPAWLRSRPPIDVASTLVHEMVHLWQQDFGAPSRRGYHNEQWAKAMESVGLKPSSTGLPGGDRVGQHMTHYIEEGGRFARAFAKLPKRCRLPWTCDEPDPVAKKKAKEKNKVKYTCPGCEANVWGKPHLAIACVACESLFTEEGGEERDAEEAAQRAELRAITRGDDGED